MSQVSVDRRPQLIVYPDALGGNLVGLIGLLESELAGWFPGGVHLLPPFPSSADRGFAPLRYDRVDPAFGSWADLERLAASGPLTLDVMVNHHSRSSREFREFERLGLAAPSADMFMRPDKVWPHGRVPEADRRRLFLRRPGDPFLEVRVGDVGSTELVWATFGRGRRESEQIDLDWRSPLAQAKYDEWFATLAGAGVAEVRLDAVGYLAKEAGTSCFMVEPQIWDALAMLGALAGRHGLGVLAEVHAEAPVVARLDARGYPTYDFALAGLVLDALRTGRTGRLVAHLSALPATRITVLDCHDGIPIQPDLVGLVPERELVTLTDDLLERGANVTRILGAAERGLDFDAHQVNISFLDAAGGEDGLVLARAMQLFAPGRPQVYYQGLLGGGNDDDAVARTGEGRAVNRTDYSIDRARAALGSTAARRQRRLLAIRSEHPAFAAERPQVAGSGRRPDRLGGDEPASALTLRWEHGDAWCQLDADLAARQGTVTMSPVPGLEPGPV